MSSTEQLMGGVGSSGAKYVQMQSETDYTTMASSFYSFHQHNFQVGEPARIFHELPKAMIIQVSRPDAGDISPMQLTYTIEFQYKQFKWQLMKKASQVFYLHFALKKRKFIEEIHEKQEQVKEWLQNLGIGDHVSVIQDDEEGDDEAVPSRNDEIAKNRDVPSSAALPIIRPALLRQHSMSDRARGAMQGYLNHFLSNIDIVNSQEVCKFLEVSKLSFSPEYGPKLKEDFIMVKHLSKILGNEEQTKCCACSWFCCCRDNWQKVWAVLKPGFLAFLKDPFDPKPIDIVVFDVLPASDSNGDSRVSLAKEVNDHNPLRHYFRVTCGTRSIKLRTKSNEKVKDWVAAINDAAIQPHEGWCHPHRFGSFAPPRGLIQDGSQAQWFVDGRAAFEAIALAIEEAKSENYSFGVHFVLMHPLGLILYWNLKPSKVFRSHHEKIVIVDHQICFVGGLDLCFGRYDSGEHQVGDYPSQIWPGKDYYNPRESEPNSWEDTMKDELDRFKNPRMPWHDVHCALWGPPCRDIARHFVQRWNYAKRNKAPNEQAIPLLLPQHHMVIPHYMGKSTEIEIENEDDYSNNKQIKRNDSFSSSYQDVPLLMPQEATGLDDVKVEPKLNGFNSQNNLNGQTSKSAKTSFCFRKSKVEPLIPDMPMRGFVDDLDSLDFQREFPSHVKKSGTEGSEMEWWEAQERGDQVVSSDEIGQVGPRVSCRCQIIRSVSQWSAGTSQIEESIHKAYCSLIDRAEHIVYIENQFFISGLSGDETIQNRVLEALYKRIVRAHNEKKCFRVIVVIPLLPGFQGGVDDSGAASVRAIMHWQYRTICRGHKSIMHNLFELLGPKMHDYISFFGLRAYGRLFDGGPIATSQVYVHSKIMIVDDRYALIGSANINDRSLLGSRDSEIGALIEDNEFVDSWMGGKSWKAGKFALSLRLSLWCEHLGLHAGEVNKIRDPVIDSTYKDIWMATAKTNTMIYQDVFSCLPNDVINTRISLRQCMISWKAKVGHTTTDLGIAPNKLENHQEGGATNTDPMERLKSIKGHLVSFPLEFMSKEDLRPVFNESEYYASPQVFH
ncbi:phospholipase D zeta 1-like isoform X2 [Salvia splendens]|uniref:phospholipase D zeta 1-like isoform X2 n=1 Tax=Salvia splendens TaxID=180675 RepID=UPI001C279E32|nr:phospholipase D zeta 1-like isoform X2 [Salvia splendens]